MHSPVTRAYQLMREHHGHQAWWPGETPFEICVGAILTQNTNWTNVEKAIENLKEAIALDRKLEVLWKSHPRFTYVPHNASFFKKITFGLAALESIVAQLDRGV